MLEYINLGKHWVALGTLLCLLYEVNLLTIVRVHYIIDIAGGLIFALFMSKNTKKLIFFSDWVLSQPYVLGCKAKQWWKDRHQRKQQ